MAEDSWVEGRPAWSRLSEWIQFDGAARGSHRHDGDAALRALGDVGLVRRLLDRAEFEAVRGARRQGRSWSEIAVQLGVTRQSAWERWRDVDDAAVDDAAAAGAVPGDVVPGDVVVGDTAPAEVLRGDPRGDAAAMLRTRARERGITSSVMPDVVAMPWADARRSLHAKGLIGVDADSKYVPLVTDHRSSGTVVRQHPAAGVTIPPGSTVTLWLERGGGSGVREPRQPVPDPLPGAKLRDETTNEAV